MRPEDAPFPECRTVDGLPEVTVFTVLTELERDMTPGTHRHPHGELFLLQSGYVQSQTTTGRWLIPAGHLCWIPPLIPHGGSLVGVQGVRIHLAEHLCEGLHGQPSVAPATSLVLAVMERFAVSTEARSSLSGPERRLLDVLRDEIMRTPGRPIVLPMPSDAFLLRVVERWLQEPGNLWDLDEISAAAGLSRRSFTRRFRLDTGVSFGEWRHMARLIRGIDLLGSGCSVTETAFALGYDSLSSFSVLCRRYTGMSPGVLARALRRDQRRA